MLLPFSSATGLHDHLLAQLDESRQYASPVRRVGWDGNEPVWAWLPRFVRTRGDWQPVVGQVLRHLAARGDPFIHIAIADVITMSRHSIALYPQLASLSQPLADVVPTRWPLSWGFDGVPTVEKVLAAQGKWFDELRDPARLGVLEGPWGKKTSKVPLSTPDDLREALQLSAKRGRFAFTEWGTRLWSWLYPESIGRPWIEAHLASMIAQMLDGTHAEVVAALDWLLENRDLWRYADALQALVDTPPPWWHRPARERPKGWRKNWALESKLLQQKELGELVQWVLPIAHEQAAHPPLMDLPELGIA